jgi:DNA-binding transcriptional LysR family regulator
VLPAQRGAAARLDLAELAGETWIAGCERCRGHLLHVAAEARFAPRIAFETDDHLTVQSLVAAGHGVSLLPALALWLAALRAAAEELTERPEARALGLRVTS